MITVENVAIAFDDTEVLDGVSLSVESGEFVALVGPNGAGKTTLLRTINGILESDSGTVRLGDERVSTLGSRAISRRVATVPQDSHVGFSFTAEQLVEMGRTPHRSRLDWSEADAPVEDAMERTETLALRNRAADDLSGGERQRVLLARALAQNPDALLLDEPTASLDIHHQVEVLELVSDLVDEGQVALAAIHDLDLAARYCDRLLLLYDGTIQARGPPATVLEDPMLAEAFGTTTAVTQDRITGTPRVAAIPDRPDRDGHVHVAGSGTGGAAALRALWRDGYDVTVGPVPAGDVTASLAADLGVPTTTYPPHQSNETVGETPVSGEETTTIERPTGLADADVFVLAGRDVSRRDGGFTTAFEGPPIRAALGGSGPRPARGDGGREQVESERALLAAVQEVLDSRS